MVDKVLRNPVTLIGGLILIVMGGLPVGAEIMSRIYKGGA